MRALLRSIGFEPLLLLRSIGPAPSRATLPQVRFSLASTSIATKSLKSMEDFFKQLDTGRSLLTRMVPPDAVRGMTEFDAQKFTRAVKVPYLRVPAKLVGRLHGQEVMRKNAIKRLGIKLKPVMDVKGDAEHKLLLFDLDAEGDTEVKKEILEAILRVAQNAEELEGKLVFQTMECTLTYEDWDLKSCMCAILPKDGKTNLSSFATVGHIVYLNLREEHFPYKWVIGRIALDKIPVAKTVVNKADQIWGQFRVFKPELLAGEPNYITDHWEHGVHYRIDFSKVFWNSRLCSVHERLMDKLDERSVLFDATCGVGPFVLPALRWKQVHCAYANDLNPDSIRYLEESAKLNKGHIDQARVKTSVMDAADFIRTVIPEVLNKYARENSEKCTTEEMKEEQEGAKKPYSFHTILNLPGLSVSFLPNFKGFLSHCPETRPFFDANPFWIHCHYFLKSGCVRENSWYWEEARRTIKEGMQLPQLEIQDLQQQRTVSSNKEMFRASFLLPAEYAFAPISDEKEEKKDNDQESLEHHTAKKPRLTTES